MKRIFATVAATAAILAGGAVAPAFAADTVVYASVFAQRDRCGTKWDEFVLTDYYGMDGGETYQSNSVTRNADGTWTALSVADPGYTFWTSTGTTKTIVKQFPAFTDVKCAAGEKGRPDYYVGEFPAN